MSDGDSTIAGTGTVVNCRRTVGKLHHAHLQRGQSSCITDVKVYVQ